MRNCNHSLAKEYLVNHFREIQDGFILRVLCKDCGEWIGGYNPGYPLPKDFSKVRGFHSVKIIPKET